MSSCIDSRWPPNKDKALSLSFMVPSLLEDIRLVQVITKQCIMTEQVQDALKYQERLPKIV